MVRITEYTCSALPGLLAINVTWIPFSQYFLDSLWQVLLGLLEALLTWVPDGLLKWPMLHGRLLIIVTCYLDSSLLLTLQ